MEDINNPAQILSKSQFYLRKIEGPLNSTNPRVEYNYAHPRFFHLFYFIGGNIIRVFSSTNAGVHNILEAQDEDKQEEFFCGAWTVDFTEDASGEPIVTVAGLKKNIRLLNCKKKTFKKTIKGHGGPIRVLKYHPKDFDILFSASDDLSIRMWNVITSECIAVFGGFGGHRNPLTSFDITLTGNQMVSAESEEINVVGAELEDINGISEIIRWNPNPALVHVGIPVRWLWYTRHNVVECDSESNPIEGGFNSGDPVFGGTFDHMFTEEGVYYFMCSVHGETGMIEVKHPKECNSKGGFIKMWDLDKKNIVDAVANSKSKQLNVKSNKMIVENLSKFTTTKVHNQAADSVYWIGDEVVSKSYNHMVVWCQSLPGRMYGSRVRSVSVLREVDVGSIWSSPLSMDFQRELILFGNEKSEVIIYSMLDITEKENVTPLLKLTDKMCTGTITCVSIDFNYSSIIAVNNKGELFEWRIKRK